MKHQIYRWTFWVLIASTVILAGVAVLADDIFLVLATLVVGLVACIVAFISPRNSIFREDP